MKRNGFRGEGGDSQWARCLYTARGLGARLGTVLSSYSLAQSVETPDRNIIRVSLRNQFHFASSTWQKVKWYELCQHTPGFFGPSIIRHLEALVLSQRLRVHRYIQEARVPMLKYKCLCPSADD